MSLPTVDIVEFLKNTLSFKENQEVNLKLSHLEFESGNISLYELICICSIVKVMEPYFVMEFGTFNGRTTLNISHNLPVDSKIVTVDLPIPSQKHGTMVKLKTKFPLADGRVDPNDELGFVGKAKIFEDHIHKKSGRIQQVWADTASLDPDYPEWKNKVDLFFIDASHTFENCYNDSWIAYEIIKRFGLIIWHDYNGWPGVTKALDMIHSKLSKYISICQIKDTSLAVGTVINKEGLLSW